MNISFNGFMENTVTFECDENVTAGSLVKIYESGKVAPCAEGDKICGVCLSVRDGFAAVQVEGFVNVPVSGTVTTGFVKIAATADGKAKASDDGREVLCVCTEGGTAGFIL